jgi:type I restriction enzyme, S subunit
MSWKTVRLGEIVIEDRKIIPPDVVDTARPYLGLEQIESVTGRILSYESNSIEGKSATFAFDESHVLYGKLRPYLNKVATPDRAGRCSTEIIPLLPKGVDRDFLAYLLRTNTVVSAAMSEKTGSRMPRADIDVLLHLEVSIPEKFSSQYEIAKNLKTQLAELETARQATLLQMHDAELLRQRLLRQTFDKLADMPHKTLGDHANITSGVTPLRDNNVYWEPAEIPWVKTGEIDFAPITTTQESISRRALDACSLSLLPPKSVLVAITGEGRTRGRSAVLEIPAATNQHSVSILPNDTWDAYFLQLWMQSSYHGLRELSEGRGGSRSALSGGQIKALKIPAPHINEQRRIITRLKTQLAEADALRAALEVQLKELDALPQRILAQAFTPPQAAV